MKNSPIPGRRNDGAFALLFLLSTLSFHISAFAQGTAFTYQGRLNDGANPANGMYDIQFAVYDLESSGSTVAGPLVKSPINVSNGLFTATLDFRAGVFTGAERWLEMGVQTNGGSGFATLVPRQKFTAAPYAITASNITGVVSSAGLAGNYSSAVTFNNPASSFSGNGGGLTNVNALTLGGAGSNGFWQVTGNAGTTPGVNFLGTTDNQALEITVNNTRALRIEPDGRGLNAGNLIGGHPDNQIQQPGSGGNTIAGGGFNGGGNIIYSNSSGVFIGAGSGNRVGPNALDSVIAGGWGNLSQASDSVIGGGVNNQIWANSIFATIAGGQQNSIGTNAGAATIAGGFVNRIESDAASASIAGGNGNRIQHGSAYSAIGGGGYNTIQAYANSSTIGGGANNIIQVTAEGGMIGGGVDNSIQTNSYVSTISGGGNNTIETAANYSTIGGGQSNLIQADSIYGIIAGGQQNIINSDSERTTIAGGFANRIESFARYSSIGGGNENAIGAYSGGSIIAGGGGNRVETLADGSSIVGGTFNTVATLARGSFIGGGARNTNDSSYSVIGGGQANNTTPSGSYSVIAGGEANLVAADHATVAGGAYNHATGQNAFIGGGSVNVAAGPKATVAGGFQNQAEATGSFIGGGERNAIGTTCDFSTISGGAVNTASGQYATVSGGAVNTASGQYATVGGGFRNYAIGPDATVGGGLENVTSGYGATVPGGFRNFAIGDYSFAAGIRAKANHRGSFVWADSQVADFASTTNDQFSIRAQEGVRLSTGTSLQWSSGGALADNQGGSIELGPTFGNGQTPFTDFHYGIGSVQDYNVRLINNADGQLDIFRSGSATPMARFSVIGLTVNGTFVSTSDRNVKRGFEPVDARTVLEKVAALPITRWHYTNDAATSHLGPVAQDFYAAFGVGTDDKHIATVDADGVALAAIQGLNQKLSEQGAVLKNKDSEIQELRQAVAELQKAVRKITNRTQEQP